MPASVTIHGISATRFQFLHQTAEHGLKAQSNGNEIEFEGVKLNFSHDAGSEDLRIEIIERPRVLTDANIIGWVLGALDRIPKAN